MILLVYFGFSLCLCNNLTGVFANYPYVCTHSHTFHTQTCFLCEFSCALQAYPLLYLCHKRCTFQLCGHFQCASSKYMLCWTFFHRCYSWTRFFGGILGSAGWNDVDCWILFHNRHIGFECSWLKVRVSTEEFDNIQKSEYFRFLTDSVNISMVVYGKSVWDSNPPRKWLIHYFCPLFITCPERCGGGGSAIWEKFPNNLVFFSSSQPKINFCLFGRI